jgi:hypothetical protein
MEDFIDKTFADLDAYYPGSKRKRRVDKVEKQSKTITDWDTKSFIKNLPNGKEVEMYTIGSLAKAVHRPNETILLWIKNEYIPETHYRLPSTVGPDGKEILGRRLYTRPMIEAVIKVFQKGGLFKVRRIDWKANRHLTNEIAEAWEQTRATEIEN